MTIFTGIESETQLSVALKTRITPTHHEYRPDIDGLRAVAVLSVAAFHYFPTLVKGGFVGVDIFFVISGYLITRIILETLDGGTFGFAAFYARRIRRIFPSPPSAWNW